MQPLARPATSCRNSSRRPIPPPSGPGDAGPAFFAYADNYLIDVKFGVIVDVEASRAIRQAEVGAAKTMIDRTEDRFGLKPARLAADTAYGSAATLDWIVNAKKIAPHIPVFDKSRRDDGSLSRRLRVRRRSQRLCLPARQAAAHDRPDP